MMETSSQEDAALGNDQNILIIMQDGTGCETTIDGGSIAASNIQDVVTTESVRHYTTHLEDSHTVISQTTPKIVETLSMSVVSSDGDVHPPVEFSMGPNSNSCLVCGDRASGYHYSVFSCEGCKGFFKRSVQKNLVYCCKEGNSCDINKYTRNTCQACRYHKCLQTGMKREAVREDRSPGGKHRIKRSRTEELMPSPLFYSDSLWGLPQTPKEDFKNSLVDNLVSAAPDIFPKYEGPMAGSISVTELMQCGYTELKYIIAWAKKVQGFSDLCMEDQMALLKSSFMELNVLRLAYRSMGLDSTVKFADGLLVPADVVQSMGWGKELIHATLEFAARLKEVHLDHTEFCILNAIVLSFPDASGIQDKESVITLQSTILYSLLQYMRHHYPTDLRRYGKMLLRLPALRTVSAKAAERFLSLTLDGNLQLNDLVLEMIN